MRALLRRTGRNQRPLRTRGPGANYRSSAYLPLLPWQVRERQFRWTRLGRRGLDPDEVQTFLERVAGDLAAVHDALRESRLETARIKEALRRWQSEQAQRGQAARR
ncbi:DivIVA domain-containing protein [Micromonospora siamensis]|uniref:DivIVA domain-containing protein n=1 Tax=Micromonospora siamensis TaxID=299152 RepID=A0A1C5K3H1_9ACTN|nr:DivIVA domain-containing protein [Micromonospora siamensis]